MFECFKMSDEEPDALSPREDEVNEWDTQGQTFAEKGQTYKESALGGLFTVVGQLPGETQKRRETNDSKAQQKYDEVKNAIIDLVSIDRRFEPFEKAALDQCGIFYRTRMQLSSISSELMAKVCYYKVMKMPPFSDDVKKRCEKKLGEIESSSAPMETLNDMINLVFCEAGLPVAFANPVFVIANALRDKDVKTYGYHRVMATIGASIYLYCNFQHDYIAPCLQWRVKCNQVDCIHENITMFGGCILKANQTLIFNPTTTVTSVARPGFISVCDWTSMRVLEEFDINLSRVDTLRTVSTSNFTKYVHSDVHFPAVRAFADSVDKHLAPPLDGEIVDHTGPKY